MASRLAHSSEKSWETRDTVDGMKTVYGLRVVHSALPFKGMPTATAQFVVAGWWQTDREKCSDQLNHFFRCKSLF